MNSDIFNNSPTAGSHDSNATNEDLQARVKHLERKLIDAEEQLAAKSESDPKKTFWKKFRKRAKKFFKTYVKPVLDFIPRFINALASYKKTACDAKCT